MGGPRAPLAGGKDGEGLHFRFLLASGQESSSLIPRALTGLRPWGLVPWDWGLLRWIWTQAMGKLSAKSGGSRGTTGGGTPDRGGPFGLGWGNAYR